jgi:hypothetical protein
MFGKVIDAVAFVHPVHVIAAAAYTPRIPGKDETVG